MAAYMSGSYAQTEQTRLTAYKRAVLGVEGEGIYAGDGKPRAHILPKELERLNILPAVREEFWKWFDEQKNLPGAVTLHRDFHHLNSSQALCLNLFFPLLRNQSCGLKAIPPILGFASLEIANTHFEFIVDRIESNGRREGTNFDFVITLVANNVHSRVFFEVKYTENGFGGPQKNLSKEYYLDRFERIYKPRLAERFKEEYCSPEGFLANYQILRNLWHLNLASEDVTVFLIPRANLALSRKKPVIQECLLPYLRNRAKIVYIEDLLDALKASPALSDEYKQGPLTEFREKYFPRQ